MPIDVAHRKTSNHPILGYRILTDLGYKKGLHAMHSLTQEHYTEFHLYTEFLFIYTVHYFCIKQQAKWP